MPNRKLVLLMVTGALLVGGACLSCASNVRKAAATAEERDITEQHQPIGASQSGPFAHPAEMLNTTAKSDNQTSIPGAEVSDGQDQSTKSIPDSRFFTYPVSLPD